VVWQRRRLSLVAIVWIIIGIIVAANRGYLAGWNNIGTLVEGLIAIILWPLVLFGVDFKALFA
jgi:hypothetical protein